jgi:hypothetical protein
MKRLMLTAAALALTTTAQAQMLQPVPMTAQQTEFYNFAVVGTWAINCGPEKGEYPREALVTDADRPKSKSNHEDRDARLPPLHGDARGHTSV